VHASSLAQCTPQCASLLVALALGVGRFRHLHQQARLLGPPVSVLGTGQPPLELQSPAVIAHIRPKANQGAERVLMVGSARQQLLVGGNGALKEASLAEVSGETVKRLVPLFGSEVGAQQEVLVDPDRTGDLSAQPVQPRQGEIGIDLVGIDLDGTREQLLGAVEIVLENAAQRLAHHGIHVLRRAPLSPEPAPEPAHGPHALRLAIPPS
jgi:hypothetical protein